MRRFQFIGFTMTALFATAASAFAGQSQFGGADDGVSVTYDDTQWQAKELAGLPYFECTAEDCSSASCLVIVSLSPDFARWPETMDATALAALTDIFLAYQKSGGHPEAVVVQPTQPATIGTHEVLVAIIGTKLMGEWLTSTTMFREAGDTRAVTCEGDAQSITASKDRINTLIAGIAFSQP